jgi:hypothetical protein
MSGNHKPLRSSVAIARLLDSEGFTDHVGNVVERYWMKNICGHGAHRRYRKMDKEVGEMCQKLTDAEKLILGKFIALHKRMSFDTGLRIGLTAFARKTDKEYKLHDPNEVESADPPSKSGERSGK